MAGYATPPDDPSLFPDEPNEYAVVLMDTIKPPSSDDFINTVYQFEDADFELPPEKPGYTYYVHRADGETFSRDEWPPDDASN